MMNLKFGLQVNRVLFNLLGKALDSLGNKLSDYSLIFQEQAQSTEEEIDAVLYRMPLDSEL